MKRALILIAALTLAFSTASAQSLLEKVLDVLTETDTKKDDPFHKTIDAGGQVCLKVPKKLLEHHDIAKYEWKVSEYRKMRVVSSSKTEATVQGLMSTPSTIVTYIYYYRVKKDGKEVQEKGSMSFTVTVNRIDPTSINMSQETRVGWGVEQRLSPRLFPDFSEADIQYDSDNTSVVTVNSYGVAYGVALGEANIHMRTSNGLETSTHVTCVIPAVSKIHVNGYNKDTKLYEGDVLDLTFSHEPLHAEPKVAWSSSKEDIAVVDEYGHVTIVGHGTVHIYCVDVNTGSRGDLKLKPKKKK